MKNKAGGLTLSDFKLYYMALVNEKGLWAWEGDGYNDNRTEKNREPRNELIHGRSMDFGKGLKNMQWENKV